MIANMSAQYFAYTLTKSRLYEVKYFINLFMSLSQTECQLRMITSAGQIPFSTYSFTCSR